MQLSSGGAAVSYPGSIGIALSQVFGSREDVMRQNEDCLALNIWSPSIEGEKKPVMVWFHGGGFNYGSGSWASYNGHNLARNKDVVVVTVNHRLNAFGFLNLAKIGGERFRQSGNVGQLDLIRSLEWLRDNIENFGGDPDNITIFGQSGGGAKVATLTTMPEAKGLFHKAIIQSGARLRNGNFDDASQHAKDMFAELGLSRNNVQKLQDIPAEHILAAANKLRYRYGPIVDGVDIPNHPFDPEVKPLANNIPIMVGFTKDEMTLYNVGFEWWRNLKDEDLHAQVEKNHGQKTGALIEAYRQLHPSYSARYIYTAIQTARRFIGATALADLKSKQNSGNVYVYAFNWNAAVDNGILKSTHALDVPFVFNNVDKGPILLGTDRATKNFGKQISRLWANFAKTGVPSARGIPQWIPYNERTRATMLLNYKSEIVEHHMADIRELLDA